MHSNRGVTRRSALTALGAVAGGGVLLARRPGGPVLGNAAATTEPTAEWANHYTGEDEDYDFESLGGKYGNKTIVQTADGGYALAADGHDISRTERSGPHIALVKLDDNGEYDWHTFVKDGRGEDSSQRGWDLRQTDDGGYLVGGDRGDAMQVARLDDRGEERWFTEIEADDNDGQYPRFADLDSVALAIDGGYVVAGTQTYELPALTKLDEDGDVEWDRRYFEEGGDDRPQGEDLIAFDVGGDAYFFIARGHHSPRTLSKVDTEGERLWTEELSSDISYTDFAATDDGGFVLTGYDNGGGESRDFVLEKRNSDGNRDWVQTYDGPFEGDDLSESVTQTPDGGYALSGTMEAAYSGEDTAAVLRTDEDGTELWRELITDGETDEPWAESAVSVAHTSDGGLVVVDDPYQAPIGAAKVAPGGERDSNDTPTDTSTDTGTAPDTEPDTHTTTPTGASGANETGTDAGTSTGDEDGAAGGVVETDTGTDGTAGGGPGFGVVAAVAGAVGVAAYSLRSRDDSGE